MRRLRLEHQTGFRGVLVWIYQLPIIPKQAGVGWRIMALGNNGRHLKLIIKILAKPNNGA
jgi:hypothetical protein